MEKVSAVYTVSVDISEEDVPTLAVSKTEYKFINGRYYTSRPINVVVNTIQGKTAERLHRYLTGDLNVKTPEEALEWIKSECPNWDDDPEYYHKIADDILCSLLSDLGYKDVVNYFYNIKKYYA